MNSVISRSTLAQLSAVMVKNIVLMAYGMSVGFPTILIPDLSRRNVDDPLHLGAEGLSWIGSLNFFFIPFGCFLSGIFTQYLGRKRTMQLINIPFCVCWLIYYFSWEVWHILLSLAISGFAGGLKVTAVITYVAEITEPNLRGTLALTANVAISAGFMLEFILGKFLTWKSAALCSFIVPFLSFILLFFVPETPLWLLSKKRYEEAKQSLAWLRGWVSMEDIVKEYEILLLNSRMKGQLEEHHILNHRNESSKLAKKVSIVKLMAKRNFIRPFMLLIIACVIVHFCGYLPITIYAVNIFTSLHLPIDGHSATALLGVVSMIGSIIGVFVIGRCGRRVTFFISMCGISIAFFVLGVYMQLFNITSLTSSENSTKVIINSTLDSSLKQSGSTSLFPFVTLIFGMFSAHLGVWIPWTLVAEVFPNETRDIGAGMIAMIFYSLGFLNNKMFLKYTSFLTLPGTFWAFSAVGAMGVAVMYFILPETEGKSLHEITEHYSGRKQLGNGLNRRKNRTEKENEQSEKLRDSEY